MARTCKNTINCWLGTVDGYAWLGLEGGQAVSQMHRRFDSFAPRCVIAIQERVHGASEQNGRPLPMRHPNIQAVGSVFPGRLNAVKADWLLRLRSHGAGVLVNFAAALGIPP